MAFKYIMIKVTNGDGQQELPIIFPDVLVHRHVMGGLIVRLREQFTTVEVVSAGVVENLMIQAVTGYSETLNVMARTSDKDVINNYQQQHGVL